MVKSIDEVGEPGSATPATAADESIARSGETLRQSEWRDELMRAGIRGKNGQMILFSRVEPFPGTRWLHADAETKPNDRGRAGVQEMPAQRSTACVNLRHPQSGPADLAVHASSATTALPPTSPIRLA